MLSAFLAILRALFPFIKEIVLQSDELKATLKENALQLTLSAVCVALFLIVIQMYAMANKKEMQLIDQRSRMSGLEGRLETLEKFYKDKLEYQDQYFDAVASAKDYQIEVLQRMVDDLKVENQTLKDEVKSKGSAPSVASAQRTPKGKIKASTDYLDRIDEIKRTNKKPKHPPL